MAETEFDLSACVCGCDVVMAPPEPPGEVPGYTGHVSGCPSVCVMRPVPTKPAGSSKMARGIAAHAERRLRKRVFW